MLNILAKVIIGIVSVNSLMFFTLLTLKDVVFWCQFLFTSKQPDFSAANFFASFGIRLALAIFIIGGFWLIQNVQF